MRRVIILISVTLISILLFGSSAYAGRRHGGDGYYFSFGFYAPPYAVRVDPYYRGGAIVLFGGYDDYYFMKQRPYRRYVPYGIMRHRAYRHGYGYGPPGFRRGWDHRFPRHRGYRYR